ncbi:NAD(P)/FAD-dependent oxidoreductase [Kordiimonas gwangyangensis]|uniref:NAD(P)/FAD-dependent oxidoreductase n=1 Tax=Kordiimonas gwangyangensis TaxID=288022 RepID=UPI0003678D5F|nr:NAD(P)/FAD-dependent oxidoreductase [Kordiimonas gwangyangensis]
MEQVECVVIGAGVVGLATARALALTGHEVLLLEKEADFGTGISSRNSEVIHAGIYYPAGSLKADLCVRGRDMLYAYCREHHVPHQRIGKLIVCGQDQDAAQLDLILEKARANNVHDLERLSPDDVVALEPALGARAALLSPSTGIVDSHALMFSLLADFENAGGTFVKHAEVQRGEATGGGTLLHISSGDEADTIELHSQWVINATGLGAQALASRFDAMPGAAIPKAYYAQGNYFAYSGKVPFGRLIYPLPEPGGLGVHLTLDLAGSARFGPDVVWCETPDFVVRAERRALFAAAIKRYWPGVVEDRLQPAFAGVRPKIVPRGGGEQDFIIAGPSEHGARGQIHMFGIESPGLTSSLAIADYVSALLERTA